MSLVLSLAKSNNRPPDREPVWLFHGDTAISVIVSDGGRKLVLDEYDYVDGRVGKRRGKHDGQVVIMRQAVLEKKRQNVGQP
mgnify:CR=1 FL=1